MMRDLFSLFNKTSSLLIFLQFDSNNPNSDALQALQLDIQRKLDMGKLLLESMGPELASPSELFDQLSLALARRRALIHRELADWAQRRQRLQRAVSEASEAKQSTCTTVSQLCHAEANLTSAINKVVTESGSVMRGFWNTIDIEEKIEKLLLALAVHWEEVKVSEIIDKESASRQNSEGPECAASIQGRARDNQKDSNSSVNRDENSEIGDRLAAASSDQSDYTLSKRIDQPTLAATIEIACMEAPRDESALKSVDEKPTISSRMADSSTEKETELVDAESLEYQASVKSDTDVSITCEQSASVCSRDQGLEWSEPFSAITCSEISGSLFTDTEAGASQFFYNQQSSYEDRNIVKSSKLFDTHDDGFSSNHSDFTNSRSISVRKFRTFMNPISVTYLKKQFYVLGSTSSRPINVYTSSGFARGAFVLKRHDDRQVACVPSILRSCQTKQWIILIDQSNDRIVCARPNGIVDAIINTHSGLQDAISTGQHIIACFPSSGIFISSLDNVEQLSQLDILGVPEPLLPVRLAWCSNSVTLLVVDVNETNSDSYRIRAFQLCDQGLKLLDFPSLAIDSSVIPSAIMNDSELVIGRLNGTTAVFSWLASNSDSMSAQYDLLELESCKTGIESFPIDMNWVPTEKGTFAVCKNSGYVIVISYSSLQHQSAKSDSAANLTQYECEPTEGIAADRAPTDRTEAEGVMSREDEHAVGMGASSLLTGDAELHTLDVSVDVVRLANDFFTEVVSETLIKGCPMPKTDNASHTVKALTACKNHSDSTLHSNSRINSERFAGKGPTEQVASHAQNVLQLFKVSKPKSAAVLSDRIYVSEGSGRGCFSVYNLTGKKLESIRLCTLSGEAVDITAHRIRLSCTGQSIIVSHPTNKQIACVNPAGRLLHSLKVPKGGFEDAICTSRQLIIACPGGRIYTAIFDNLTEIKLCSTDLKMSCPVRMAWCNKSETLLVVDRTSIKTEEYRILAFKIDCCQLTALPAPRLTIQSSVAPNVLLKADEMVLVWVSDSTCTISWLPTNAMHLAAEHCSATIEDISPRDICWLPPETSSFGEAIICDAKGSVLAFRRPLYG